MPAPPKPLADAEQQPCPPPPTSSLTRHRSFVRFWCARTFTNGAFMMQGVAVGWQIYALTNDPLDLGLVGLVQFFPADRDLGHRRTGARPVRPPRGRQRLPDRQGAGRARARRRHRAGLARPRGHVRHPVPVRHGAGLRNSHHARAPARRRADGAAAARDRGLGFRPADRGDLRARRSAGCCMGSAPPRSTPPAPSSSSPRAC